MINDYYYFSFLWHLFIAIFLILHKTTKKLNCPQKKMKKANLGSHSYCDCICQQIDTGEHSLPSFTSEFEVLGIASV